MEELRFHFLLGVEHLVILILIPVVAENSRNGAEIAEIIGLLKKRKEHYGYACLTKEKRYYMENHPGVAVENGSLDEAIVMMIQGETV